MSTIEILLPDELRAFVETRIRSGEYRSTSDYLSDLIRHDHEEIDQLLIAGLESGESRPFDIVSLQHNAKTLLCKGQDD
jgi:antitoxin ParD1/3/4